MFYYPYYLDELALFVIGIVMFFTICIVALQIIGSWLIFKKAGEHPWASVVPFYGSFVMYKITWGQGWMFLVPFVAGLMAGGDGILASLAAIVVLVFHALTSYKLSLSFGHGIGFAVGLFFMPFLFRLILGLSQRAWFGVPLDGMTYEDLKRKFVRLDRDHMQFHNPNDDNDHE